MRHRLVRGLLTWLRALADEQLAYTPFFTFTLPVLGSANVKSPVRYIQR